MFKVKLNKQKVNPITTVSAIVVFFVIFMTLGFAALQETGLVTDIGATVRAQADIRITGVTVMNPVSGAISNYENFTSTSVSSTIQLPNRYSKLTYAVEVTNFGNVEMVLKQLTGLPSNLKYTLNANNYKLNEMICDDNDPDDCTLGAKKTINITIEYESNAYDSSNTTFPFELDFVFEPFDKVAQVGSKYFQSLHEAIAVVPTDGTPTTVILLKNTSDSITIAQGKNVILNLQNNILSNDGNTNVIQNNGTLSISSGTIRSDAATNGAVNNNSTGTFTMSGGSIIMTGGRQALYNDKGIATITGNAYLSSSATARAAVQNVSRGTMTITGGTIVSTGSNALNNAGTLTIGTEGGELSITSPEFRSSAASANGITSTANYSFYDGIVKSKVAPFNDVSKITVMESGYGVVTSTETIDGTLYNIGHLGISRKVTFNGNGGTASESTRYVAVGTEIGPLPTATRSGHIFAGWWTAASGGTQIDEHTIINENKTFYAHWSQEADVARIGNTLYPTLASAISAVPANTQTTIELLKNTSEILTVESTKDIIIDLGGKTLSNSGANPVITTSGTLKITNGSIHTSANQGAINETAGILIVDSAEIIATGDRQAIYITGGTTTIKGSSYLSSATSGKPSGSNMERGTVQVISGTLIVESGTIIGTMQQAISNEGTVILGVQGGSLDTTSPVLQGAVYGIKSTGTFNFYDGIVKGKTRSINGTVTSQEANTQILEGTETIDGDSYYTKTLELIP